MLALSLCAHTHWPNVDQIDLTVVFDIVDVVLLIYYGHKHRHVAVFIVYRVAPQLKMKTTSAIHLLLFIMDCGIRTSRK